MGSTDKILRFSFTWSKDETFFEVSAEKKSGKLQIKCTGFNGHEKEYPEMEWSTVMDEGDWDKLMMAIEDADALKWKTDYYDENNAYDDWNLEIHIMGRYTVVSGSGKYPATFDRFFQDLLFFVRLKRKQLTLSGEGLTYFSVSGCEGNLWPTAFVTRNPGTVIALDLWEVPGWEGAWKLEGNYWNVFYSILTEYDIFGKFREQNVTEDSAMEHQYSIVLSYQQGKITLRSSGEMPEWWGPFSEDFFRTLREMVRSRGNRADLTAL